MGLGTHIIAAAVMRAPPSLLQCALPSVTNALDIMWAMTSSGGDFRLRLLNYRRHSDSTNWINSTISAGKLLSGKPSVDLQPGGQDLTESANLLNKICPH